MDRSFVQNEPKNPLDASITVEPDLGAQHSGLVTFECLYTQRLCHLAKSGYRRGVRQSGELAGGKSLQQAANRI